MAERSQRLAAYRTEVLPSNATPALPTTMFSAEILASSAATMCSRPGWHVAKHSCFGCVALVVYGCVVRLLLTFPSDVAACVHASLLLSGIILFNLPIAFADIIIWFSANFEFFFFHFGGKCLIFLSAFFKRIWKNFGLELDVGLEEPRPWTDFVVFILSNVHDWKFSAQRSS